MRMNAIVGGVGMSRFGKHVDTGLKALGAEVVHAALDDAGLTAADLEAAFVGNAMAGICNSTARPCGNLLASRRRTPSTAASIRGPSSARC